MSDETYGMYTPGGNAAVQLMVEEIKEYANTECEHCHRGPTESELRDRLTVRTEQIENGDTDVRDQIYDVLKDVWHEAGHDSHSLEEQLF